MQLINTQSADSAVSFFLDSSAQRRGMRPNLIAMKKYWFLHEYEGSTTESCPSGLAVRAGWRSVLTQYAWLECVSCAQHSQDCRILPASPTSMRTEWFVRYAGINILRAEILNQASCTLSEYPRLQNVSHVFFSFLFFLRYVVLVSGLCIGEDNADQLALQMFLDLVSGQLGGSQVSCLARLLWNQSVFFVILSVFQPNLLEMMY